MDISFWRTSPPVAWSFLIGFAAALSCASRSAPEALPAKAPFVRCVAPRPNGCARENLPVCGLRVDGSEWTYSGSCSACGHMTVVGHRDGEC